jgi:hypothetical protein
MNGTIITTSDVFERNVKNDEKHLNDAQQSIKSDRRKLLEWLMSDASAHDMQTPYFNQKELLKRGWTKDLISRMLGKADWKSPNPHGPFAPMLCWDLERVIAAEESAAFQEHCARKPR